MFSPLKTLATLATGFLFLAATPALAEPAMWVIRDEDSTIYLFGTVHVLKKETQWRSPKFEKALGSADELWLEIDQGDDPSAMQGLVMAMGMDKDNPLSGKLSPAELTRFNAATAKLGVPQGAFDPFKPWMAGLTLSVLPLMQAGYDPTYGVDELIKAQVKTAGKPVRTFETAEQQLSFFDGLPLKIQIEFLMSAVDDMDDTPAMLDKMVVNWSTGNVDALEEDLVESMRKEYPELYKALLIDRNTRWATVLADRLQGSGVSFVAVGSGHLIGPDSVQTLLARKGIKAERF
jgi:uncharacterized protein YbaP (TraB family)